MFQARAALEDVYPRLVHYAITTFGPADVLRFLGQPVPANGKVPHHRRHEVSINVKERVQGIRLKYWHNGNSLKLYDKGSVLRSEMKALIQPRSVFSPVSTSAGAAGRSGRSLRWPADRAPEAEREASPRPAPGGVELLARHPWPGGWDVQIATVKLPMLNTREAWFPGAHERFSGLGC